ncbi:hypothetical protein B0J13DRAFT_162526 [Dactylonectria estremocensis]|uniref:Uncharacterized protein n=1 Tax=Dactylonectria estremocensis TaxID=1079267 RepID=A0A9P9DJF2_9HYPO|nr:hypothetical protein B0J13DRAFT_162526 [Dactylonectria estremocensis]
MLLMDAFAGCPFVCWSSGLLPRCYANSPLQVQDTLVSASTRSDTPSTWLSTVISEPEEPKNPIPPVKPSLSNGATPGVRWCEFCESVSPLTPLAGETPRNPWQLGVQGGSEWHHSPWKEASLAAPKQKVRWPTPWPLEKKQIRRGKPSTTVRFR